MNDLAEMLSEVLPEGWSHDADRFGMSFTLICPHGHQIEQDGRCPDGCTSPLVEEGWI